jgi:hypothetical protein
MRSNGKVHTQSAWVTLIALLAAACSSDGGGSPVPPKGNATVEFQGCIYAGTTIHGADGAPTAYNYGGTVTHGSGGYVVKCSVNSSGAVDASIESPDMRLEIRSSNVSSGAEMSFYVSGTGGTPEPVISIDSANKSAANCTLTTSRTDTLLMLKDKAIFAEYDCPMVGSPSNIGTVCHARGLIYFKDCG